MNIRIEPLLKKHFGSVSEIYMEGIKTNNSTFETVPPSWRIWDRDHSKKCRIVAIDGNLIVGWAALIPVSNRGVYSGVAEVSVYIRKEYWGIGVGTSLLEDLINESEKIGIWTLQSGIFPENLASLKLHEKMNFRIVGRREKLGKMNGMWRDILLLERRSKCVGN